MTNETRLDYLEVKQRGLRESNQNIINLINDLRNDITKLQNSVPQKSSSESRWVYLTTPLTSTSWDGDSYSTTAKTLIDLSAVFKVPPYVKAVLAQVALADSGSAAGEAYMILGATNGAGVGMYTRCSSINNDIFFGNSHVVACDANGDIYYQLVATGASTLDIYLEIHGYYI